MPSRERPAEEGRELGDALVARVAAQMDLDALAAQMAPQLADVLTSGLSLDQLRDKLLGLVAERICTEELLAAVSDALMMKLGLKS